MRRTRRGPEKSLPGRSVACSRRSPPSVRSCSVLDDIHWAEPTLLDLVEYLVAFSSGSPILVLCLSRPELLEDRPTWAAPRENAGVTALEPLLATRVSRPPPGTGRARAPGGRRGASHPSGCRRQPALPRAAPRAQRRPGPRLRPGSPTDDPGAPRRPPRPARRGGAAPARVRRGRGRGVSPSDARRASSRRGPAGARRCAARPRTTKSRQAARGARQRGRRGLRLRSRADQGRRLRGHTEGAARRAPRAARHSSRGRRVAPELVGNHLAEAVRYRVELGLRTTRPTISRTVRCSCSEPPVGARSISATTALPRACSSAPCRLDRRRTRRSSLSVSSTGGRSQGSGNWNARGRCTTEFARRPARCASEASSSVRSSAS